MTATVTEAGASTAHPPGLDRGAPGGGASTSGEDGRTPASGGPRRLGHRPTLDGIRGIAVLLVVFFHGAFDHFPGGFLGVDVFFVLSGFLITTLLLEEWGRKAAISLKRFYARRVRRLLPGLVLLLVIGGVLEGVFADLRGSQPYLVGVVGSLLYVNNWILVWDGSAIHTLSPTWSLAVEDQFYLLWPFALLWLLRRRVRPAHLLAVTGAVVAVALAYMVYVSRTDPQYNLYMSSIPRAGELALGAALSVAWRERWIPRFLRSGYVAFLALALIIGLGFNAHVKSSTWLYTRGVLFGVAVCAALVIAATIERPDCFVGRLLRLGFLRYTGKISYGMYLYNFPLVLLFHPNRMGVSQPVALCLRVAGAYAAAALSWWLVESRFTRSRHRRAEPAPTASHPEREVLVEAAAQAPAP